MLGKIHLRPLQTKWLRTVLIAVVVAAVVAPVTAFASNRFNDVPNGHTFHDDITWLANNGVTKGCNPPNNTRFCPDRDVTRGQMAAFMRRLATRRVVNADKVDGRDASSFLGRNAKAKDSDRLDGRDSSAFAKVRAFYTVEGEPDDMEALGGGDYLGALYCGTGDVAISGGYIEESDQFVWSEIPGDTGFFAAWRDDGLGGSTALYMYVRCLDVNGNNTSSSLSSSSSSSTSSPSPMDQFMKSLERRTEE